LHQLRDENPSNLARVAAVHHVRTPQPSSRATTKQQSSFSECAMNEANIKMMAQHDTTTLLAILVPSLTSGWRFVSYSISVIARRYS
jgi:hypothetical protein